MMLRFSGIVPLFAVLLCAWCGPAGAAAARRPCVILVTIDGLANFYLDDPLADMPTLHKLAREGARARGMVSVFPTVTWPNHVALVTGASTAKTGVVGNSYLDRATGKPVALICDPVFDKDQTVKVPTVFDAAHAAGLKIASISWPATRNARTLDWNAPDMFGDGWDRFGTKSWLAELRGEGIPVDRQARWCNEATGGCMRDWLYTRMAAQVIQKHAPNLLLLHLVEMDHVEHRTGPRSPEAYWCARYSDDRIRDLVEAVEHSKFAGKTTIFVCSDHGFQPVRHNIHPNVLLRKLGLLEGQKEKPAQRRRSVCRKAAAARSTCWTRIAASRSSRSSRRDWRGSRESRPCWTPRTSPSSASPRPSRTPAGRTCGWRPSADTVSTTRSKAKRWSPISRPQSGPTAICPTSPPCWPPAWSGGRASSPARSWARSAT